MTTLRGQPLLSLRLEREGCTPVWMSSCGSHQGGHLMFPSVTRKRCVLGLVIRLVCFGHTCMKVRKPVTCLQKLHQIGISLGKGSEVKVHQPWLTSQDGYTSIVTGNFEDIVVTSDLSYPHLARATSLQVHDCGSYSLSFQMFILPFAAKCGLVFSASMELFSMLGYAADNLTSWDFNSFLLCWLCEW